jgi:hypothetical protein
MCGINSPFKFFISDVSPIVMKEPLADFLGAYQQHGSYIEYDFEDAIKLTGHACPTVAAAFVCCRKALGHLYLGEIAERGNIAVTVHGARDEKVYGVMANVISLITGAADDSGFKGIGDRFKRSGLLTFDPDSAGELESFTFARQDKGSKVKATISRKDFPSVEGEEKLSDLMDKVIAKTATHDEGHLFQDIWMERVKAMVLQEINVDSWLIVEKVQ